MSQDLSFSLVTKATISAAISSAKRRLIFCAPGADDDIAKALTEAVKRLPETGTYIHIDPSQQSLLMGYGTENGVAILAELRRVRIAKTWRLGLLIADDEGWLYAPTPESHEQPRQVQMKPNGVALSGRSLEEFTQSIQGSSDLPILLPKPADAKGPAKAKNGQAGNGNNPSKDGAQQKSEIPTPRDARKLAMVRHLFKVVRFHHSLSLADRKVRLTAKDFGLQTKEVDPQLAISYAVVSKNHQKEVKKILSGFDKEIEKVAKTGLIQSLHPQGYVVWYEEPGKFEKSFVGIHEAIDSRLRKWFEKNYGKVQEDSKKLVTEFLSTDLFKRVKPAREIRHHGLTDKEFRDKWVEEQAVRFQLPAAEEVLKTLRIGYDLYDISQQLLKDRDFVTRFEGAFGIKLDELLEREESGAHAEHPRK